MTATMIITPYSEVHIWGVNRCGKFKDITMCPDYRGELPHIFITTGAFEHFMLRVRKNNTLENAVFYIAVYGP